MSDPYVPSRICSFTIGWYLLAACLGCRALPITSPPSTDTDLAEGQLIIHSDFSLPSSHRLIREVVAERDDVCRTLALPQSDESIHVYLFRDSQRYGAYVKKYYPLVPKRRAFFLETDTRLAVYAQWSDRVGEDLRHEVAHGYLHSVVPNLPLWLDEGLAEYFEVPRGQGGLNRPHVDLLADMIVHENWQPDVERLESIAECAEMAQHDYAESWAWVHFLLETEPARRRLLQDYLADLRGHGKVEPLSQRLGTLHVEPGRTLQEYVLALRAE